MIHLITTFFLVRRIPGSLLLGVNLSDALPPQSLTISPQHATNREEEYAQCLLRNIQSPLVASIQLLVQQEEALQLLKKDVLPALISIAGPRAAQKIVPVLFPGRPEQPLYSDLFEYANHNALVRGQICCVANADVYFSDLDTSLVSSSGNTNVDKKSEQGFWTWMDQFFPPPFPPLNKHGNIPNPTSSNRNSERVVIGPPPRRPTVVMALTRYESEDGTAPLIDN